MRERYKAVMSKWEREMERSDSSPGFSRNKVHSVQSSRTETFSDMELKILASVLQHTGKAPRQDAEENYTGRMIYVQPETRGSCQPVGRGLTLTFSILIHSASVAILLLLYFQLGALIRDVKVADDRNSLQTRSQLQQKEDQHQQTVERLEQHYQKQYQVLYSNYSTLQESYQQLRDSHVLIPQHSALLENCKRNPSRNDGVVCPICYPGWKFFGNSCYMVSSVTNSWQRSLHWCRMEGGHLAVINNMEEQVFLQGLLKTTTWIGLSDRDFEGEWHWVDGTPYAETKDKLWVLNQPDNAGNEDCVSITPVSGWSDDKCMKAFHSVCEDRAHQLVLHEDTLSNL